ncbi:hypothetical protein V6V47_31490 [Micromonospora sp. CPCC 205539]
MPWLAVTGGGGGTEWPAWAIGLFLVAFVLAGIFVLIKRRGR